MIDVVIVFNPLVGYLTDRGSEYVGDLAAQKLKSNMKAYLKSLDRNHTKIFMTREIRSVEDSYFKTKPTGFLVGSDDVELVESFKHFSDRIFNTLRSNALYKTPLLSELKKHSINKIKLIGLELCSSILFTVPELMYLGYNVEVIEPLTVSSDPFLHSAAISIGSKQGVSFVRG